MIDMPTHRDVADPGATVSVLVPTKNAGVGFKQVLEALFEQEFDGTFEVIVVDSGSTDGTRELAACYPVKLYSIPPNSFGHGYVRNALARLAVGDTLVFLSSDGIPVGREWLAKLVGPLADPCVAATYGRQLPAANADLTEIYLLYHFYPPEPARRSLRGQGAPLAHMILFSHVNAACKKALWEQYPYNERLIMSEDLEWSRTVLLAGYEIVYVPEAAVTHSHAYTLRGLFRRNFDSGASLRAITRDTMSDWLMQGTRYLVGEVQFLIRSHNSRYLVRACTNEAVRCAGFMAGFYHAFIPRPWKPYLSQHRYHWQWPADPEVRVTVDPIPVGNWQPSSGVEVLTE